MKTLRIILVTIFSLITTSSYANMSTAHLSDDENMEIMNDLVDKERAKFK